ncbi:MAG: AAA family ATPase, partial [Candidatus Aminicenantes bacterium]
MLIPDNIGTPIRTNRGRIDQVIETDSRIYIFEFRLESAQKAINQIHDKKNYEKYQKVEKKQSAYYNKKMKNNKLTYRQDVAFINRESELQDLRNFVDKRPSEILFLHGPKSSGKTTLLYKFLEKIQKEQKLDIKFLNLREKLIGNYKDFIRTFFGVNYIRTKENLEEDGNNKYSLVNFCDLPEEVIGKLKKGELDPFEIMIREFIKLNEKDIKPLTIIDELNAIKHIYMENGKEKRLITELLNFFITVTNKRHLAHIIISSSNLDFLNNSDIDSKLRKSLLFYKVDYLPREDVMEWLLNLEKYSKIKDYTLTEEDAEKIWDTVGGSMW